MACSNHGPARSGCHSPMQRLSGMPRAFIIGEHTYIWEGQSSKANRQWFYTDPVRRDGVAAADGGRGV